MKTRKQILHPRGERTIVLRFIVSLMAVLIAFSNVDACFLGKPGTGKVRKLLHSPSLAATNYGIKIIALPSGKTLYEENSTKLFVPASNVKILTAYTALKVLRPQFTFTTTFAADTFCDSSTVNTLFIKGGGDPSLTLADINYQAMSVAGKIRRVAGDIIVDTTYFDTLSFGRGWMWDEGIASWNAPIAPYALEENCIDIYVRPGLTEGMPVRVRTVPETCYATVFSSAVTSRTDDICIRRAESSAGDLYIVSGSMSILSPERKWRCTVSKPALYAGTVFKELLRKYGTTVDGTVFEGCVSTYAATIDNFSSRSLVEIVRSFLKESDNLESECILKTLGAHLKGEPGDATKGIAAVKCALKEAGIDEKNYVLADGSGLSTYNQLSPDIMTKVLAAAYRDFSFGPEFVDALSVAGKDGTMKERLKDEPSTGLMRMKTGNMTGISCLSGYLQTKKGNILAVSVMMNGIAGSGQPLRNVQDELLKVLWELY